MLQCLNKKKRTEITPAPPIILLLSKASSWFKDQRQASLKATCSFLFSTSVAAFSLLTQSVCGPIVRVHTGLGADPVHTQPLANARIHSDKDACLTWAEKKAGRATADSSGTPRQQGFSRGLKPECPWCWNLRRPVSPAGKCFQSLICSFQPVLLMSVLCYSVEKKKRKKLETLTGSRIFSCTQCLARSFWKSDFFLFFPLSLKNDNFFVAWMRDAVFTRQGLTACERIYNRVV